MEGNSKYPLVYVLYAVEDLRDIHQFCKQIPSSTFPGSKGYMAENHITEKFPLRELEAIAVHRPAMQARSNTKG